MAIAFLFPGQGSQAVGMGRDLIEGSEAARRMFALASTVLGYDAARLCLEGPKERLDTTLYTQPSLYVLSCALVEHARAQGLEADAVAGHSVGEYAALFAAGVFSFDTGLRIVAERARLMYAAGGGRMLAVVGMDPGTIEAALAAVPRAAAGIGLYNSPGQVVVSGTEDGVAQAEARLREAGARKLVPLSVSGAFHSEMMRPVQEAFAKALAAHRFSAPRVPYVSNVTGEAMAEPEAIRAALAGLLVSPVRWLQSVRRLAEMGVTHGIELGPGRVLGGLVRQTCRELACLPGGTMAEIDAAARQLAGPDRAGAAEGREDG